ncbi:cell wall biogenesis protein-like protein Ecm15, partial [Myriangium duriaei CBS 260.36]
DFCLIPLGTPTASVSQEIAHVQRLLARSGLKYEMHSAGTTVEGAWSDVMTLIGRAHGMLHQRGIVRIQSDIRVGSRTDKVQGMQDKVDAVRRLLAADGEGKA